MRNIYDMAIIEVEITNLCNNTCSNCTRFCGHYTKDKIYFISEDDFRKILRNLKDFPGRIGMMGGEPTLHPNFKRLVEIFIEERPDIKQRYLLTNMTNDYKYEHIYKETFVDVNKNDHISDSIKHTPILVSSNSIMKDFNIPEEQIKQWIDNCWVQNTWSATVTPKGAFFCEVAGMLDYLFNGPGGVNIDEVPDWWKLPIESYKNQIDWACSKCGCAIPLIPRISNESTDDVSEDNLKLLKEVNSPKVQKGKYCLYNKGIDTSQIRDYKWYWGDR
jgi:hypothetical protein